MIKTNTLVPGMLVTPPLLPDTAPFSHGRPPFVPRIDPNNLHPHMMGILGIAINDKVIQILGQISHNQTEGEGAKSQKACPKCDGKGFLHESSVKHDKKAQEKCKNCIKCKGIYFLM